MAVQSGDEHPESYVFLSIGELCPHGNLPGSNLDQSLRFLQEVLVPLGMVSLTPIGSDQDMVIPILKIGERGNVPLPGIPAGGSQQKKAMKQRVMSNPPSGHPVD